MFTTFRALALCLAALAAGPAPAQPEMTRLPEPAAVPLDFLAWIGRDPAWLGAELERQGLAAQVTITEQALETADLAALKAVNRIRAFAQLAAKGLRPPVLDLALEDGSRCLTRFPNAVVPGIGADDFAEATFTAEPSDPALLDACRVGTAGDYAGLDRATFRERYFDASGVLRPEFAELGNDAAFMAAAIDHGFFLSIEDYSGLIRVDLR